MVNFETVINYYKYVYNIRGIHTVATGLESTSVVFAYGLGKAEMVFFVSSTKFFAFSDLFCTRVFPSRIFDQLKDDFDFHVHRLVDGGVRRRFRSLPNVSLRFIKRKKLGSKNARVSLFIPADICSKSKTELENKTPFLCRFFILYSADARRDSFLVVSLCVFCNSRVFSKDIFFVDELSEERVNRA